MSDGVFRPGAKVRLILDSSDRLDALSDPRMRLGLVGTIVATRPLVDDSVLVKFKGISSPISIDRDHLELV